MIKLFLTILFPIICFTFPYDPRIGAGIMVLDSIALVALAVSGLKGSAGYLLFASISILLFGFFHVHTDYPYREIVMAVTSVLPLWIIGAKLKEVDLGSYDDK